MRTDVTLHSHGTPLAAYVYRPDGVDGPVPCVVMAHGFTCTREMRLPAYAERFTAAGIAVVLFDYRHFGASGGEPRQLLDIAKQHQDYHRAIAYARSLDFVDPDRIVLWGSSFSGGHVVAVAAKDKRVAAVIAQVPFSDGFATLKTFAPLTTLRLGLDGLIDQARALAGRSPRYIKTAGDPGTYAALTAAEVVPGFASVDTDNSLWRNEFAGRLMLHLARYRPITVASTLTMPVHVSLAADDHTVPVAPAERMARLAPKGEVVTYPIGHFQIYTGAAFERAIADQLDFLARQGLATVSAQPAATAR